MGEPNTSTCKPTDQKRLPIDLRHEASSSTTKPIGCDSGGYVILPLDLPAGDLERGPNPR
jgi:hypothetical protein